MQPSTPECLSLIFKKQLFKPKWVSYVEELDFSSMSLTDASLLSLGEDSAAFFASMPFLKVLNLCNNGLTLHAAHWMAKGLLQTPDVFLQQLQLNGNCLGNKGVKLLAQGISNCKLLAKLGLGDNGLDDSVVTDLLPLLEPCEGNRIKVKELLVFGNRLTSVG